MRQPDKDSDAINELDEHHRQVRAVMAAVAKLTTPASPMPCTPEAVFEGATKGAAVALLENGASADDVAGLLTDMAAAFAELDKPQLRIVQ